MRYELRIANGGGVESRHPNPASAMRRAMVLRDADRAMAEKHGADLWPVRTYEVWQVEAKKIRTFEPWEARK